MFSKISALAFMSSVSAAATALPTGCSGNFPNAICTNFPKYAINNAATAGAALGATGGFACLRQNFAYIWPANKDGSGAAAVTPSSPATGSNIQAFYGSSIAALGTVALVTDAATTLA